MVTVWPGWNVSPPLGKTTRTTGPCGGGGGGGGVVTVKLALLVTAPFSVTTLIGPVVAPGGTVVPSSVSETSRKTATWPLKKTFRTGWRLVPRIDTWLPTGPLGGAKLAIVGVRIGTTVKPARLAVPEGLSTLIGPEVASGGTVASTLPSGVRR